MLRAVLFWHRAGITKQWLQLEEFWVEGGMLLTPTPQDAPASSSSAPLQQMTLQIYIPCALRLLERKVRGSVPGYMVGSRGFCLDGFLSWTWLALEIGQAVGVECAELLSFLV